MNFMRLIQAVFQIPVAHPQLMKSSCLSLLSTLNLELFAADQEQRQAWVRVQLSAANN